ncbi:chromosome segregation protein SMC [Clostridium thermarum]|uniref:chromosome segregation protein SMC n=1 Tax=Clostridium thermarum TaxID=1716543 RepID=UPI001124A879|nr:chromosome segregation protein SMC [Clostridium thermarum]
MFLKSLEIRGFKSFADKTELKFKNGVTAVVGPNGSGKSNISDAVRWVLGEQSIKTLRGGKMEDVIFAGTMFRKPVGLAQVAITLDNSDYELPIEYSDVTISRRLYRSGESEYYINNTLCRLKDIHELFMDTGIGKEGYSIIGQGKIEAILSGRPEDRRNLIEEAAGIVKFKSRKEEAEKKLENTEQNLVRINDILSTYEERLEPLRIEHEKAKQFLELSKQLTEQEVALIIHYIQKNEEKIKEFSEAVNKIDIEIEKFTAKKEEIKGVLDVLNKELEEHEQQSLSDKERYYNSLNVKQSILSNNQVLAERIANLKDNISKYEKEIEELDGKILAQNALKTKLDEELGKCQQDKFKTDEEIKVLEDYLEDISRKVGEHEQTLAENNDDLFEVIRKITEFKNELNSARINHDNLSKRQEQLKTQYENYKASLAINTTTAAALEEEKNKIYSSIEEHQNNIKEYKKQISALVKEVADLEKIYKDATVSYNKLEANHSALLNLEKHYEGYNRAVKTLMLNIENGKVPEAKDKAYVLGNVIKVPDNLVEAIEVALGGAVSDIITEDDDIAKLLINHLKVHNLGRATFLPLNIITGKKLNLGNDTVSLKGFIGIASDLVEFDKRFTSAVNYVLGRTIICENMDNALIIAKKTSYSFKIVTLSGDVVNPGGSLTGGSQQNKTSNIFGRKREIKDLESKMEEEKANIQSVSGDLSALKTRVSNLDNNIMNERDQIHYKEIEITKIQGKITAIAEESDKLKQNAKLSVQEIQSMEDKVQEYSGSISSIEEQIKQAEVKEAEYRKHIDTLQAELEEKKAEMEEKKENFIKLKINKAQNDEVVNNKIKELERIAKEIEGNYKRKEELCLEISKSEAGIHESQRNIDENNIKISDLILEVEAFEERFREYEVIKIDKKENIKKMTQEHENTKESISAKEAEKHKLEMSMTKYELDRSNMLSKLNDEYNLTLAEAQRYKKIIENPDIIKKEVTTLKSSISQLGVVNVGSIEEYEKLQEKYSFMNSQKEDLINAKAELLGVINEMTAKMKEVFNENFNKLRVNFNETFRELFKGGSADLILGEGDELTAAIDINVQPPGKKLQNINLMSGGEKGLSAIALLFAILKMKPTPFCILDEIEAALDDANVARYAEFLKTFSEKIQFIVITHRKGTMEASDVLYGVTMEEKGVSKIVSVDLSK